VSRPGPRSLGSTLVTSLAALAVLVAGVLGIARPSEAVTGVVQVAVVGALAAPSGTTGDTYINLRVGRNLAVLGVGGGAVVPGAIGAATFAQWTDTLPTTGFGSLYQLFVIRVGGGLMFVAAGVSTPGGFVTTFSATDPIQTLSGTWTMTTGAGVTGAGAGDAVLTFTFDSNSSNTFSGFVRFVGAGMVPAPLGQVVQGVGTVGVARNVPLSIVAGGAKGPRIGTLTTYSVGDIPGGTGFDFVSLTAIDFDGVYLVYGAAFPGPATGIERPAGGSGPLAHLSGDISEAAGQFFTDPLYPANFISGVTVSDLVISLFGSLP
jgi:hypothetical protein